MSVAVLLAVDDRPDNLFVLEQLLATYLPDIKLLAAPNAEAGLQLAASEAIDGALIDVQMPGMDGIEMCRRLKTDQRTASIHVILVTAHRATPELKAQGLESGADDFIAKPIDNVELAAKLRVMLRLRAAEQALRRERDHLEATVQERTQALRDAEYRYRTLFHAASDAIFLNNLEGRMLEVNEEACRLLSYTREELLRLKVSDLVTPENIARRPDLLKKLRTLGHLLFETEHLSRDGRHIPTECSSRLMDHQGQPAVLSIVRDITERKLAENEIKLNEARLASLVRISQYQPESIQDLLDFTLHEAIALTSSKIGYIYFYNDEKKQFILNTWSKEVMTECAIVEYQNVYELEKTGIWGEAVRQARPMVVNDFQAPHPLKKGYPEGHANLYKYLTIPVFSKDRIVAVMAVANKETDYDAADVRQVSLMMDAVWKIVDRQRGEVALRESEEKFRLVFEKAPIGIMHYDREGTIADCNEKFAEIIGAPKKKFVGSNMIQKLRDEKMREAVAASLRGEVGDYEGDYLSITAGKLTSLRAIYQPIYSLQGEFSGGVSIFEDITQRKQDEEALTLHTTRLQALLDLQLLAEAPQEQIIDFALKAALTMTQSEYCWVGMMDEAESVLTVPRWSAKVMEQCAIINKLILFPVVEGELWWDCVRQKKAVLVNDYQAPHPYTEGLPEGHVPIRRFLAVPVLDGGRTVAVAAVANKVKDYPDDDLKAFSSLINKMWELLRRKQAEEELKISLARTTEVQEGTILAMSMIAEVRDPYTAGHQRRVTQLACAIAQELGLPKERVIGLRVMGLLHDLGKISIPAEILSKPGKLSEIEFTIIKSHARAGYEIVKEIRFPWPVAEVILQHHERLDGSGYPQGLQGDEIVLDARILAVADVVEAMASHRPYRPALGIDKALEEISQHRGVLYDPEVVDVCVRLFKEKGFHFD